MQLELIEQIKKQPKKIITDFKVDDLIFLCDCLHLDSGHTRLTENCNYETCDCKRFKQKDFEMEVVITVADVFSLENPELEFDSPQFWLKLGEKLSENL